MSKQILAPIFQQNTYGLFSCVPSKPVSCDNAIVQGIEWFSPVVRSGILDGYKSSRGSVKPQNDAVKTIRVQNGGNTYWIAIADGQNESVFLDACNACCDAGTPVIAAPTIPPVLYEDLVCADDDGNFLRTAAVFPIASGQKIIADLQTCDGVALTPVADVAGFTSFAAFVTWATSNWGAYGSFAIVGNNVVWTSTCEKGSLNFTLKTQDWCFSDVSYPKTVHSVVINGNTVSLPFDVVVTDRPSLIAAIASILGDGVLTEIASKVNYKGTGAPGVIKDDTAATISTPTLGICS